MRNDETSGLVSYDMMVWRTGEVKQENIEKNSRFWNKEGDGYYVGGIRVTGSRVLIWPKDYDKLPECGFKFGKGVLEYYKKHGTPVVLYPPALSRKERKRLKEVIEKFKRRNNIE